MSAVAIPVALLLAALAVLHVYWAGGGVWPGSDQKSCARSVAGFRGIERMPTAPACIAVAAALAVAAAIAIGLAGLMSLPVAPWLLALAGFGATVVFLGCGIAGFTPAWRRLTPEMPFARNDPRYFSPLCLLIGAGFAFLCLQGLVS